MDSSLPLYDIATLQGDSLYSPFVDRQVRTQGVVTGLLRRGFYFQDFSREWDQRRSNALFVYSKDWMPQLGAELEVSGTLVDYQSDAVAKPVTQLHLDQVRIITPKTVARNLKPVLLTAAYLAVDNAKLAVRLNALEGMLVRIPAGATFIAPSNPFGDYVVHLEGESNDDELRTEHHGILVSPENPNRWYPGFRVRKYPQAKRLNVGARLKTGVQGPLHYRVGAWQVAVDQSFDIEPSFIKIDATTLVPRPGHITVMTLNCFNLDPHIESAERVMNPRQDVDDDWGDGRFHSLANAVVLQARCPDIIALQEIQDNDGAEITEVVAADETFRLLIKAIEKVGSVRYQWVNIDPQLGSDGGQPGGNIRNGFLYNPERVSLEPDSVSLFARLHPAFVDSRKPIMARFTANDSGKKLTCINVHLASKRHQRSIFAPELPGVDEKLDIRLAQASEIADQLRRLTDQGHIYYLTGDFNDTEFSQTLQRLCQQGVARNLVLDLPEEQRYDYNHRGKLQVLMHALVPDNLPVQACEYEILHGNELLGVEPGAESNKASDHAYVIVRLQL